MTTNPADFGPVDPAPALPPPTLSPFAELEPYLFDPARQAASIIDWLRRVKSPGYRLTTVGIRAVDEAVTLFPGSLTALAARPGMGKSLMCKHLAARAVAEIRAEKAEACVVYVTLEESEKMVSATINGLAFSSRDIHRGNFDLAEAERRVHELVPHPGLHVLAHPGIIGPAGKRRLADPLTSRRILDLIARIEITTAGRQRPRLVVLDYLQLLQPDRDRLHSEQTKTAEVMVAVEGAKTIADATGAAVVMAVQAGRETDNRRPPLPTPADMQHASAIEQACDTIIGLLRPIRHSLYDVDPATGELPDFTCGGRHYPVTPDLMVMSIAKQRHGVGHGTFIASMDVDTAVLSEHPWNVSLFAGGGTTHAAHAGATT